MHATINGIELCALVAGGFVVIVCAGLLALFVQNERAIVRERIRARLHLSPVSELLDWEITYRNRGDRA